jgi:replication factor A1
MEDNELTPHLEQLKKVLAGKVDDKQLIDELKTYIDVYHLDAESAVRGIIRKHGGADIGFVTAAAVTKKIGELNGTEQSVDITAKVVFVEKKQITARGEQKTIIDGILGDDSATASFTFWGDGAVLDKGASYTFRNCYTKKWNDKVQINIGTKGVIEKSDAKFDLPERSISYSSSEMKIKDLREGLGSVTVTGRILSVETRNITIKDQPRTVYSGIIADDTGKVQFSAWNDFGLKDGETICIKNGYVRGWKGIPQLNIGDRAEISRVDDTFKDIDVGGSSDKTVGEILKAGGGGLDIVITGTIVDIRNGSGLIKRCPQCNRSILNDQCVAHGSVVPVPDLRLKIVVDDGTGAISAVINRECTEKLTNMKLEDALELSKTNGPEAVVKAMASKLLVKKIVIRGNIMSDDYGPMMIVRNANIADVDVKAESEKLLSALEAAL